MKRDEITVPVLWLAVTLVVIGLALSIAGIREAIVATGVGLVLFVGAAWVAARPSPRQRVSAREITPPWPYGPDPNLVEFADRLRDEARESKDKKAIE